MSSSNDNTMIPFDDAFDVALTHAPTLDAERAPLDAAVGRILAENVRSDLDMPPFNKSAMDGYACRRADLGKELAVVEFIPAGTVPEKSLGPGQCAKIMTGAMVPDGADCVVMVEYTESPGPDTVRFTGDRTADNICMKAEDIRAGDVVMRKGARLLPQHIAILATVGCTEPLVAVRPHVAVIATGDELVEPAEPPAVSQIRNSNSSQLCAQIRAMGALPQYYGIARDTEAHLDATIKKAMNQSDVVCLSGGVSMGDLDLVPGILRQNGVKLLFEKIAVKPGKPTVFGLAANLAFFGLSGNPVATFIIFEVLVKPFLLRMMGHDYQPPRVRMPLEQTVSQRRADRLAWMPVCLTPQGTVALPEYHGSAHINALEAADGLIAVPAGVRELAAGTLVDVRLVRT